MLTHRYVPSHFQYIISELIKNAFRATVEHHWKQHGPSTSEDFPPIRITISLPPNPQPVPSIHPQLTSEPNPTGTPSSTADTSPRRSLSLRIRDQGGGVSPANLSRVFSYAFTTASHLKRGSYAPRSPEHKDSSDTNKKGLDFDADSGEDDSGLSGPYAAQHVGGGVGLSTGLGSGVGTIAGLGYGLPMSRLYARYFGGELDLISMDGWGKSIFLFFNVLSKSICLGTDVFVKLRCLDEAGDAEI